MKKTQFWPGTSQIYLHGLNVQGIAHKLCHCVTCLTAYPQGHLIRTVKALNCKANRDLVDSTNASADAHAGVFKLGEVAYQIRVCLLLSNCDYDTRCANDRRQAKGAPPNLSFSLQDPTGDCKGFLSEEMETNAVIGAIHALVHPDSFHHQFEVLLLLSRQTGEAADNSQMKDTLDVWASPFSGINMWYNWYMMLHQHRYRTSAAVYEVFATFGTYDQCRFKIPELGRRFVYNSGSALAFAGGLLEHGLSETDGYRVSMVSYFRPKLAKQLGKDITQLTPPKVQRLAEVFRVKEPSPN
jgi:hypothetical protein